MQTIAEIIKKHEKEIRAREEEHIKMMLALAKPGLNIQTSMTPEKCDLWHGATGVCTEAGELLDAVKKHAIYEKDIDRENVIEELGDIEFYLAMVRHTLDISRDHTLRNNIEKLAKRYGEKYSNQAAQERADKV